MDEESETIVTGAPVNKPSGARRGEVLGERYEIQERIGRDAFTLDYRALDQETERTVLVRVLAPALCRDAGSNVAMKHKLRETLGVGGAFLPGLVDADSEGGRVFVVEAMPSGTTLRDVFRARRARGELFEAHELLPVMARLDAALAAVPPPLRHGDVRAERVWLDPDELVLTGSFVLSSLPPEVLGSVVANDVALSRVFAPEVGTGAAFEASDRWGAACLAYEGLVGRLPEPDVPALPDLGRVGDALCALLAADPSARPSSLADLVSGLAEMAGLPVPELDPGAFKRPPTGYAAQTARADLQTKPRSKLGSDTVEEEVDDLTEGTDRISVDEIEGRPVGMTPREYFEEETEAEDPSLPGPRPPDMTPEDYFEELTQRESPEDLMEQGATDEADQTARTRALTQSDAAALAAGPPPTAGAKTEPSREVPLPPRKPAIPAPTAAQKTELDRRHPFPAGAEPQKTTLDAQPPVPSTPEKPRKLPAGISGPHPAVDADGEEVEAPTEEQKTDPRRDKPVPPVVPPKSKPAMKKSIRGLLTEPVRPRPAMPSPTDTANTRRAPVPEETGTEPRPKRDARTARRAPPRLAPGTSTPDDSVTAPQRPGARTAKPPREDSDTTPIEAESELDTDPRKGSPAIKEEKTQPRAKPPQKRSGAEPRAEHREIAGAAAEGTQEISAEEILEEREIRAEAAKHPEPAKRPAGASPDGTQEIRHEDILEQRSADSIDPRLLRAALDSAKEPGGETAKKKNEKKRGEDSGEIDPRLMRAALGVELESQTPIGHDKPSPERTEELDAGDLEMVAQAAAAITRDGAKAAVPGSVEKKALPPAPAAPAKPAPATKRKIPSLSEPSAPAAPPRPSGAPASAEPASPALGQRPPDPAQAVAFQPPEPQPTPPNLKFEETSIASRPHTIANEFDTRRRKARGRWIILGAMLLATIIILAGILIATQNQSRIEREQRLQERFEQLQQTSGDEPPTNE